MSVLSAMVAKEKNRNENMIAEYSRELETLPKGSIKSKTVKGRAYYYLTFRAGDKVVTKYIGKDEGLVVPMRGQLARRKQVEEILKKLRQEKAQIQKLETVL